VNQLSKIHKKQQTVITISILSVSVKEFFMQT